MDVLVRDNVFHFKQFDICQDKCLMKVCTDGVLLGSWVGMEDVRTGMDIGTGSGVISLMLAQRSKDVQRIVGVEIDDESYNQACSNAIQSNWADRLEIIHASIQDFMKSTSDTYDLIVSNPPFFTGGTLSESQPKNQVRHTVKLPHSDLLRAVKKMMSRQGRFGVILPAMEGYRFIEMAEQYRLYLIRQTNVITRVGKPVERLLMEFSHKEGQTVKEDTLYIYNEANDDFSKDYKELTGDFYLNI